MNGLNDFHKRIQQVKIATHLSRSNHILQSTVRSIWAQLVQGGIKMTGKVDKDLIELVYIPFTRDALASILAVGYFAYVIDDLDRQPRVLEPDSYIVVKSDAGHLVNPNSKKLYNIVLCDQQDCDQYKDNPPELFIQHAPTRQGILTCPSMSVVDMHDAIIEFTRLALLNDAINLRPKAWISSKDNTRTAGVYHFLDASEVDSSELKRQQQTKKNREGTEKHTIQQNLIRARQMAEHQTPRTFSDTCISRQANFDAVNDPSIMVEVTPNMDITAMGQTHTRNDLVELIHLFDRRMCNALGIPTVLLGIPTPGSAHLEASHSIRLWENIIMPYRNIVNLALTHAVEKTIVPFNALNYKKTKDTSWLQPIKIYFESCVSFDVLMQLQTFMTEKAFAERMASHTGLKVEDFKQSIKEEDTKKKAKITH